MTKELLHVYSCMRGYHAYLSILEPKVDEMYTLKREPQNKEDSNTVAIVFAQNYENLVLHRELQDLDVAKLLQSHIITPMK